MSWSDAFTTIFSSLLINILDKLVTLILEAITAVSYQQTVTPVAGFASTSADLANVNSIYWFSMLGMMSLNLCLFTYLCYYFHPDYRYICDCPRGLCSPILMTSDP